MPFLSSLLPCRQDRADRLVQFTGRDRFFDLLQDGQQLLDRADGDGLLAGLQFDALVGIAQFEEHRAGLVFPPPRTEPDMDIGLLTATRFAVDPPGTQQQCP